jgi:hypothetical protein
MSNSPSKKTSKIPKTKKTLFAAALALTLLLTIPIAVAPLATAHTPPWTIPTYAYIAISPSPVGVNQPVFIMLWLDKVPPTSSGQGGDRWRNYVVEVSKPDGTKQTLGPYTSDATSSTFTKYTPNQVGTYTFLFKFPGQTVSRIGPTGIPGYDSAFINDTYTGSNATATLIVQQEQLSPVPNYPLPSSYWTRPIEGENTAWEAVASNWLGGANIVGLFQKDGIAPNTPHIMWTKPFQDGGVVGGNFAFADGMTFYNSLSYETKFGSAIIMYGRIYYALPRSNNPSGNGYVAADLRTGETLWWKNETMPSFGQYYMYDSPNQHGVIPNGYLWRTANDASNGGTVWMAYDPLDGNWLFNLTNVPSGTTVRGGNGELTIYQFNNNAHWLALWNNTAAPNELLIPGTTTEGWQWRPIGKNINASTAYSWNITNLPALPAGSSIRAVIPDDMILGTANWPPIYVSIGGFSFPTSNGYIMQTAKLSAWAISLKPATRGQLIWLKEYPFPDGNLTRGLGPVDPETRVWTATDKETMQWLGYSLDTGDLLWGPVGNAKAFQFYGNPMYPGQSGYAAYGRLYTSGYGGILYSYDLKNGNLLWTYGNGGQGNSTNSGLDNPWGNFPIFPAAIADGKIYVYTTEHSPNAPPYKGSRVRAIDAYTGKEVWTLLSWSSAAFSIADGYLAYLNLYDYQIYSIGKGPSATKVEAPMTSIAKGQSIVIRGTVTDQTPSSKDTPAISDADMGAWMEYLHMQKPIPANATGVPVKLTAIDQNSQVVDIATVTSDISGLFYYKWTPQLEGTYKIIATFEGTEAYWPSYGETAMGVDAAPSPSPSAPPTSTPTTSPPPTATATPLASPSPPNPPAESPNTVLYVGIAAAVTVIALVAVALVLRRRK